MTDPSKSPLQELAAGPQSLDEVSKHAPVTITREMLGAIVAKEREARAAWKTKQAKKGRDE